jgi:hypothetical protein
MLFGDGSFGGRGKPGLGHFFRYTRQECFTPPLRVLLSSHRLTVALSPSQYSSIQHSSALNKRLVCGRSQPKTVELAHTSLYNAWTVFSRRPTRSRLHIAVVATLLFCALAVVEFPELLNLKDDTSNDFTLLVSSQDVGSPSSATRPPSAPVAIPVQAVSIRAPISNLLALSFPDTLAQSPIDYLHLLCVHRT